MDFSEYQRRSKDTAIYVGRGETRGLAYVMLGVAGSAGQVADQAKKIFRDDNTVRTLERRKRIKHYLGATLWYIAMICNELRFDMDEIANDNLALLADRKERGVLTGDGPDR